MHIVGLMGMPRRVYTYADGQGWGIYNLISTIGVVSMIVPGIAVFILNVIRTHAQRRAGGEQPVGRRHPRVGDVVTAGRARVVGAPPSCTVGTRLWDQDDLHSGDERLVRFVRGHGRLAAAVAGGGDRRHCGRAAAGDLPRRRPVDLAAGRGLGVVMIFVGRADQAPVDPRHRRRHRRRGVDQVELAGRPADDRARRRTPSKREHGVPVNAGGSVIVAAWGMGLAILFVGIAFASLLLAYFYLRLVNPVWPPPGVDEPGLLRAGVAAGLLAVSGRGVYGAVRRVRAGEQPAFVGALVVTLLLAIAGLAIQYRELTTMDFGATAHAYGSIFHTLAGFIGVITVGGIAMLAMALYWAVRGHYTQRRHATVANVARFWTAAVVIWIAGFGTLYLGPYLT